MKKVKFTLIGKMLFLVLSLLFFGFASQAQAPASNITGPLSASVNGANITVTSEIAFGTQSPTLTYTLLDNTSGATVVSQGQYTYNSSTRRGTQQVIIAPGSNTGGFVVRLVVTTPQGTGSSSMSVDVQ